MNLSHIRSARWLLAGLLAVVLAGGLLVAKPRSSESARLSVDEALAQLSGLKADGLPIASAPEIKRLLDAWLAPETPSHGLDTSAARGVRVRADPVWVIPGAKGTCLLLPDPVDGGALSCATNAQVSRGELRAELMDPRTGTSVRVGVVPDGITAVTRTTDAGARRLAVRSNLWSDRLAHSTARTASLSAIDAHGGVRPIGR